MEEKTSEESGVAVEPCLNIVFLSDEKICVFFVTLKRENQFTMPLSGALQ